MRENRLSTKTFWHAFKMETAALHVRSVYVYIKTFECKTAPYVNDCKSIVRCQIFLCSRTLIFNLLNCCKFTQKGLLCLTVALVAIVAASPNFAVSGKNGLGQTGQSCCIAILLPN